MSKKNLFLVALLSSSFLVGCVSSSGLISSERADLFGNRVELSDLYLKYGANVSYKADATLKKYCEKGLFVFTHDDVTDVETVPSTVKAAHMNKIKISQDQDFFVPDEMLASASSYDEIGDAILLTGLSHFYHARYEEAVPYLVCAAENYQSTFAMYKLGQIYAAPDADRTVEIALESDYKKSGFWLYNAMALDMLEGEKSTITAKALGTFDRVFEMELEDDEIDIVDLDIDEYLRKTFPHLDEINQKKRDRRHGSFWLN